MTSTEPTPPSADDEVLAPATPGAQALPTDEPEDSDD